MPAKKSAKKSPAKKSVEKSNVPVSAKKKVVAKDAASANAAQAVSKSAATPATARKKASEFVTRPSHTPAIFKPNRRTAPILFTIEDVREILVKRHKEEAKSQPAKSASKAGGGSKSTAKEPAAADTASSVIASRHAAASLDDILGLSNSIGTRKPPSADEIAPQFRKYFDLLTQLRKEVSEELTQHSSDTLKRSQKEDSGDLSISVDAGTDNFDRDFALSLLSTEQEALKEIDAAIQRIYKGTYGVCEVTGKPIDDERLEAVPFTRFSLEGQRQHESTARRRSDRPGIFLNDGSGEAMSFGDDDGDN